MLKSWKKIPQVKRHMIIGAVSCLLVLLYSFFAVDSVLDFMSRTVIMMLFASALNIILGFGGLRPLGMATYFGMGSTPTLFWWSGSAGPNLLLSWVRWRCPWLSRWASMSCVYGLTMIWHLLL